MTIKETITDIMSHSQFHSIIFRSLGFSRIVECAPNGVKKYTTLPGIVPYLRLIRFQGSFKKKFKKLLEFHFEINLLRRKDNSSKDIPRFLQVHMCYHLAMNEDLSSGILT